MENENHETDILRDILYAFTKSTGELMYKMITEEEVEGPYYPITMYRRGRDGTGISSGMSIEMRLDRTVSSLEEEILSQENASECIVAFETHPIIQKYVDCWIEIADYASKVTAKDLLLNFIATFFEENASTTVDDATFDREFERMISFFKSETVQAEVFIPLENFECDEKTITLVDGWRIEQISDDRIPKLVEHQPTFWPGPMYDILNTTHALVRIVEIRKHVYKDKTRPESHLNPFAYSKHIISALRILKSGFFIPRAGIVTYVSWYLGYDHTLSGSSNYCIYTMTKGSKYRLLATEQDDLKKLIFLFKDIDNTTGLKRKQRRNLDIATRRFNYGLIRSENEDRLIDFMIALESLFLQENTELSYRLSLRIANFVGEDADRKKQIFNLVRNAYTVRSLVVHGAEEAKLQKALRKSKFNLRSLVKEVEDILRVSLAMFAKRQNERIADIIREIDGQTLEGT